MLQDKMAETNNILPTKGEGLQFHRMVEAAAPNDVFEGNKTMNVSCIQRSFSYQHSLFFDDFCETFASIVVLYTICSMTFLMFAGSSLKIGHVVHQNQKYHIILH